MAPRQRSEADEALDLAVIEKLRARSPDAFEAIVVRYTPAMYSMAYRMLGGDREGAQEAVQEIFLRVHRGLPSFDARRRFFPWLYTIALNCLRSLNRAQRSARLHPTVPFEQTIGAGRAAEPCPDELAVAREGERLAQWALDSLPRRLRSAFVLREVEGLSTADVAQVLRVPESTVRTWIFRARARLREMLLDVGWE